MWGSTHLPVSVSFSSNTGVSIVQAPWRSNTAVMAAKAVREAADVTREKRGKTGLNEAGGTFLSDNHLFRHDVSRAFGDFWFATSLNRGEQLLARECGVMNESEERTCCSQSTPAHAAAIVGIISFF